MSAPNLRRLMAAVKANPSMSDGDLTALWDAIPYETRQAEKLELDKWFKTLSATASGVTSSASTAASPKSRPGGSTPSLISWKPPRPRRGPAPPTSFPAGRLLVRCGSCCLLLLPHSKISAANLRRLLAAVKARPSISDEELLTSWHAIPSETLQAEHLELEAQASSREWREYIGLRRRVFNVKARRLHAKFDKLEAASAEKASHAANEFRGLQAPAGPYVQLPPPAFAAARCATAPAGLRRGQPAPSPDVGAAAGGEHRLRRFRPPADGRGPPHAAARPRRCLRQGG
ncbi:unnamed protein product [Vitrella brassicaformis CCMP3155]|uniref:Uncharacterized protein n=1 Tax=Vitrella brassicaformis (strain CCMP3155) TaxID=1169540 RepID=A0A0G4EB32_VITBC|nr:unnamed protein product [Vitrella brassicaformis CCMP3155]|eukprot:CEL93159.1 unnamed protein product [Vitrella brassicaformis CCMP3155]